jgi:hypothetical protein
MDTGFALRAPRNDKSPQRRVDLFQRRRAAAQILLTEHVERRLDRVEVAVQVRGAVLDVLRSRQLRPSDGRPGAGADDCIACDGNGEEECVSTCSE